MNEDFPPCPCERIAPEGAPGPVADTETVIRFVPVAAWIAWDGEGKARLRPVAFPEDELKGSGDKSVSVLRGMTPSGEISRRAAARNKEPAWANDPVTAEASVLTLRQLLDKRQRREMCVNADPLETDLGFCPTHASILRAYPPLDKEQRLAWAVLRLKLATAFSEALHCSGQPPMPILS